MFLKDHRLILFFAFLWYFYKKKGLYSHLQELIGQFSEHARVSTKPPHTNLLPDLNSRPTTTMPRSIKTSRKEHSNETRAIVIAFHKYGISAGKIHQELSLPKSTVISIICQWRKRPDASTNRIKRLGPAPKLNERAERHLIRYVARNPFNNIKVFATPGKIGCKMHYNTVRKYLAKNYVYAFRPHRKPFLKPEHKKQRFAWARIMVKLEDKDWALVEFSDEATFKLRINTRPP